MIARRLTKAAFCAAVMALFAAAPASAAVIVYSFEGLGKFKTQSYALDYITSDESSSEEVFDHVPFQATLTIDTNRLDASTGGLLAEWSGVPVGPSSFGALSAPFSSNYDGWSTSNRGVFFDIMRSTVEDGPNNGLINSSFTSEARLRLLDNELTSAPIFMIDGYSFPDLTDFMVEFSLNTFAFQQTMDFADLFVENGEITQIFSVGRATMTVANIVPEPPQWALLGTAVALFGASASFGRRKTSRRAA